MRSMCCCEGEIELVKRMDGTDVVLSTTSQPGSYAGVMRAFISVSGAQSWASSLRTVQASRLFKLSADDFAYLLQTWFPMAVHLLDGMFLGLTNADALIGQREKLIALGALSAGLAHELNNPAAAEVRAAEALNARILDARSAMVKLAPNAEHNELPALLAASQRSPGAGSGRPRPLHPGGGRPRRRLGRPPADNRVDNPWDLAPVFASAGLGEEWLDRVVAAAGPHAPEALRWLAAGVDMESLVGEIRNSAGRISELVAAMKDYSHLDQGPFDRVDIHEGIDTTLLILKHKWKNGVNVVREYDVELPEVCAQGGELNQVWTNMIDNAIDAMDGQGTLTIRTSRDRDCVLVEIGDTGPGIPPELQRRIFDPFFTTKEVGKGTGLGLDISYRIVVRHHHGDVRVDSQPGSTWLKVWIPIDQPTGSTAPT